MLNMMMSSLIQMVKGSNKWLRGRLIGWRMDWLINVMKNWLIMRTNKRLPENIGIGL